MSLLSLCQSIQSIGFLTDIRESAMVYPVIMTTHLSCIALFGGMILMTDMRLLGFALKKYTVTEVVGGLRPWKRVGFCIMITMGLLLAGSEAEKYYHNPYFWVKMCLLLAVGVHALIFRPSVYNRTEEIDRAPALPARAKAAGALSLIIWCGVLTFGRLIGYYEGEKPQAPNAQAQVIAAPLKN
ncbi:MAG TPA: DUF6644 family protein [Bryobacteraceae bacterium]|nr:DUF6644 family protein [Bryobacteraceae bacterium]